MRSRMSISRLSRAVPFDQRLSLDPNRPRFDGTLFASSRTLKRPIFGLHSSRLGARMAGYCDYHSTIARAISDLPGKTEEARGAVYELARTHSRKD